MDTHKRRRPDPIMQLGVLFIVLSLPLIELAVMIKVGQAIGVWSTLLLIILAGIAGGLVLQQQGFAALNRMMDTVRQGRPPIEAAVDSAFLVLAGVLLIIPGFITDVLGLALLVPPLRRVFAQWLLRRMDTYVEVRMSGPNAGPDEEPRHGRSYDRNDGGVVIEGEYERVDDPPKPGAGNGKNQDTPRRGS